MTEASAVVAGSRYFPYGTTEVGYQAKILCKIPISSHMGQFRSELDIVVEDSHLHYVTYVTT